MHQKTIAWIVLLLAAICTIIIIGASGLSVDVQKFLILVGCIGLLSALQAFYTYYRSEPVFADIFGTLAFNAAALSMVGVIALAGLTIRSPLIDNVLIQADESLGLTASSLVIFASHYPYLLSLFRVAYEVSFALIIIVPTALAMMKRSEAAWNYCSLVAICGLVSALISIFYPAVGAFTTQNISSDIIRRLPDGSGLYHITIFSAYRDGIATTISPFDVNGVVTFPSLHAVFALTTASVFMNLRKVRVLVLAWSGIVFGATIVIGGHYYIDLIAGTLTYGLCSMAMRAGRPTMYVGARTLSPGV